MQKWRKKERNYKKINSNQYLEEEKERNTAELQEQGNAERKQFKENKSMTTSKFSRIFDDIGAEKHENSFNGRLKEH